MNTNKSGKSYLNPLQVIRGCLPDLKIGPEFIETMTSTSLREVFIGDMRPWASFKEDVSQFYGTQALFDASEQYQHAEVVNDLDSIRRTPPYFVCLEHTQVAEERDLHGRFLHNVMDHVDAARKALFHHNQSNHGASDELADILPEDFSFGSAKAVPIKDREAYEPDIVIKIPGSGKHNQEVRIISELKFCVTCNILEAWEATDRNESQARHSFRYWVR